MSRRVRGHVTHIPISASSRLRPRFSETFAGSSIMAPLDANAGDEASNNNPFAHLLGPSVDAARHIAHNYQQRVAAYLSAGVHDV
jgi:hypothetical protein